MWPRVRIETLIFLIGTMLRRAKCKRVFHNFGKKKVDKNSSLVRRFSYVSGDIRDTRRQYRDREKEKDDNDDSDDDDDPDDDSNESGVEKKKTTKSGFCRL